MRLATREKMFEDMNEAEKARRLGNYGETFLVGGPLLGLLAEFGVWK